MQTNILHYYEDNFVTPSYYLYFSDNCSFSRSEDDLYYDGDPRCSAAIVVKHQECDGVLIICYKDNHTSIIPMKTISELTTNEKQYLRADSSIHSINIGQQNDYLLSIIKQYHGHREIFIVLIKYLKYQCPQTSLIPENCFVRMIMRLFYKR